MSICKICGQTGLFDETYCYNCRHSSKYYFYLATDKFHERVAKHWEEYTKNKKTEDE